jgi:hypothetical protein
MIEGKVDYLGKPSTRSTQTPSSWSLGLWFEGGERENVIAAGYNG